MSYFGGAKPRRIRALWGSRDPRQAKFVTIASLKWIVRNKAWTPFYLIRYWRFMIFRLKNPHILTRGFVFLGKDVEIYARPGFGRIEIGRWVHIGDGNAIRCHEGSLRIGDKCVFGRQNVVNCYLDIEFGPTTLVADWVYICDFDHVFSDIHIPIKDQGIYKRPIRFEGDTWLGTKVTILKGVTIGWGSVIAAHAVVNKDIAPYSVAVGVPVRVVNDRRKMWDESEAHRKDLADLAAKIEAATRASS